MNLRNVIPALFLAGISPMAVSGSLIADTPDGVSCRHIVSGSNMAWKRGGGDWKDATGTPFGSQAFSMAAVPLSRRGQVVHFDVTELAKAWNKGAEPAGGIFLAIADGSDSGIVRFHSRESGEQTMRPELRIKWLDGKVSEFAAIADSSLNCTTSKGIGGGKTLTLGRDRNAILLFPFEANTRQGIESAELILTVQKQYAPGASVAVYRPLVPWAEIPAPLPGISASYPADEGITKHRAVVFAEGFESSEWKSNLSSVSPKSHAALTGSSRDNKFEPIQGKALQVTVPPGGNVGLNALYRFAGKLGYEPEEMYFRYVLRLGDDWDPFKSGGKLPGFAGTYNRGGWGGRKSDGTNGWSSRGTFFQAWDHDSPVSRLRGIGSYVYSADMKSTYGSTWGWNGGTTAMLEKNRWYSVEQQVRLNTPGKADGVLRAWLDGRLVFEKTDIRFRDVPDLKIETLWMNVYHGGTTPAPQEMSLYIDNVVIAREYIGPFNASGKLPQSLRKGL